MTDEPTGLPDDPLSYEIPDEPTTAHLVAKLIVDFTVFETGMKTTAETSTPLAAMLFEGQITSPAAQKNQFLIGYARGAMDVQTVAGALRRSYQQEAERLEQDIGAGRAIGYERTLVYLRKLAAQPDRFFVETLEMVRPTLRTLASYNQSGE